MNKSTNATINERKPRRMARQTGLETATAADPPNAASNLDVVPPVDDATSSKPTTKTLLLLKLLTRAEGASLDQMVAATGWLPHTTRSALTGIKHKGHALASEKVEGMRIYRITPAEARA